MGNVIQQGAEETDEQKQNRIDIIEEALGEEAVDLALADSRAMTRLYSKALAKLETGATNLDSTTDAERNPAMYKAGGLVGKQGKLDKNKDGKISGADFKMMKKGGAVKSYAYGGRVAAMSAEKS